MAKCIRCGKPCNSGENMCDECKAWFQEKTGGSVVSGVKSISKKTDKKVKDDSKNQNNEQEKEKQTEAVNQDTKPAVAEKNNSIVIPKKTLFIIIVAIAIVMIAVVAIVLKQKGSNKPCVAEVESFDNNDVANEESETEKTEAYEDTTIDDEVYDEVYDEDEMTTEEIEKVSTYQYIKKDISWNEAEWEAEDAGGHLAVITSEEEYNKVCGIANESGLTYIWIGARINSISDDWSDIGWITGEDWTFDNWYPNEPSRIDTSDNEDELYLCLWNAKYNDSDIGWTFNDQRNDIVGAFPSISGKVGYIIEFEE